MKYSVFVALSMALAAAAARPKYLSRAEFTLKNGQTALAQNQQFASLSADSPCTPGQSACVSGQFAQCVNGKFVLQPCASGLVCAALPLVNSPGTSITCTTTADRDARIAATGASQKRDDEEEPEVQAEVRKGKGGAVKKPPTKPAPPKGAAPAKGKGRASQKAAPPASTKKAAPPASTKKAAPTASTKKAAPPASSKAAATTAAAPPPPKSTGTAGGDAQTSLTLDPSVIAKGFAQDGQATQEPGQVPSLTSTNNFINFCATVPKPLTNGQQVVAGSCNPAPMGVIAAKTNMPAAKFVKPANLDTVRANTNFTVQLAIAHLETGHFVNANTNYFAAPQVVNAQGDIQGHSHIVIEHISSLKQTTPTDPTTFAFFKGLNAPAQNGQLTVEVPGLPAGTYRMATINTAANHQPALVAIAQHGALDDMIYFTVQ
ncbi:hypothetical protein C8Q77DRAFT_787039 [Trametes polyzona]|nr:hypothetical protein C8Q77DRAFT_787039 [Trametes polyzona]